MQGGEWRDKQSKLIDRPSVNFAGKYNIVAHSLGTGARYYTLTDLSTGRSLSLLDRFATTEASPKLPNGMHYLFLLGYRKSSHLLRVGFQQVDWVGKAGPCYERYFLLTEKKLLPVRAKRYRCTNE